MGSAALHPSYAIPLTQQFLSFFGHRAAGVAGLQRKPIPRAIDFLMLTGPRIPK